MSSVYKNCFSPLVAFGVGRLAMGFPTGAEEERRKLRNYSFIELTAVKYVGNGTAARLRVHSTLIRIKVLSFFRPVLSDTNISIMGVPKRGIAVISPLISPMGTSCCFGRVSPLGM